MEKALLSFEWSAVYHINRKSIRRRLKLRWLAVAGSDLKESGNIVCKNQSMEEKSKTESKRKKLGFWKWAIASVLFRLIFSYFSKNLNLSSRPEVSTPLTSLRRRKSSLPLSLSLVVCVCVLRLLGCVISVCVGCIIVVAEGYWLKQLSMSPYSGLW